MPSYGIVVQRLEHRSLKPRMRVRFPPALQNYFNYLIYKIQKDICGVVWRQFQPGLITRTTEVQFLPPLPQKFFISFKNEWLGIKFLCLEEIEWRRGIDQLQRKSVHLSGDTRINVTYLNGNKIDPWCNGSTQPFGG